MKRAGSAVLGLALAALGSSACGVYTYPSGLIYSGTQTPHGMMRVEGAGAGKSGTKENRQVVRDGDPRHDRVW